MKGRGDLYYIGLYLASLACWYSVFMLGLTMFRVSFKKHTSPILLSSNFMACVSTSIHFFDWNAFTTIIQTICFVVCLTLLFRFRILFSIILTLISNIYTMLFELLLYLSWSKIGQSNFVDIARENAILPSLFIWVINICTTALLYKFRLGFTLPSKYLDKHFIRLASPTFVLILTSGIMGVFSLTFALYHYIDWMLLNVFFVSMIVVFIAYLLYRDEWDH